MSIYYVKGNIFNSTADALVNPVNTVGVMGKGLALQFAQKYPYMLEVYKKHCFEGKLKPGNLHYYNTASMTIINFPTKEDWRDPSKMEYIERGLANFVRNYKKREIKSVAFPPLGCGLDGLKWSDVKPVMERHLIELDIDVFIYEP